MEKDARCISYNSNEGMIITNRDEKIVAVNDHFLAAIGSRKEQVIGRSIRLWFAKANDFALYPFIWKGVLQRGYWEGTVRFPSQHSQFDLKHLIVYGLEDNHNRNHLFIWRFSDGVKAEHVLDAICKIRTLAIVMLRDDLTIKHWNETAELLFGWEKEAVIDRPLFSLFPNHLFDFLNETKQVAKDHSLDWKCKMRKKDETVIDAAFSMIPVMSSAETAAEYVLTIMEVAQAKQIKQKKRVYEKQLEFAKKMQQSILTAPIQNNVITMDAIYIPAEQLSGDVYACYQIDDVRFAIVMIDVIDHDLSSFLIMLLRSLLREIIHRVVDPVYVALELENYIKNLFPEFSSKIPSLFSMIYAVIDTKKQQIEYTNAGHPSGFLLTNNDEIIELDKGGLGIGSPFAASFEKGVIHFQKRIRLFLYTDGLLDEVDSSLLGGVQKIRSEVKEYGYLSDHQFLRAMLDKYLCGRHPEDDVCLLSVTIKG
ncbi:SpoIIE family protein phosphatase [Anoxybacteroides tepidamans]|uniref:SpoIIE family protein phosphatase n=1 Tax=Anoxybacteroides tepidamans TaxID=265948 RepID=UPI000487296F|nr:SpoIIE family protein phosphatase [Anoxybacillus tepidamans]